MSIVTVVTAPIGNVVPIIASAVPRNIIVNALNVVVAPPIAKRTAARVMPQGCFAIIIKDENQSMFKRFCWDRWDFNHQDYLNQ